MRPQCVEAILKFPRLDENTSSLDRVDLAVSCSLRRYPNAVRSLSRLKCFEAKFEGLVAVVGCASHEWNLTVFSIAVASSA